MIEGHRLNFGVSGLLYQRNVLFYDRQTDSLWSQLLSQAVTGPMAGKRLTMLPAENTTWGEWKAEHPDTKVMSYNTGYTKNYHEDPYRNFLLAREDALLVSAGGVTRIYPFAQLKKAGAPVVEQLGGHLVTIEFDKDSKTARLTSPDSQAVTFFVSFLANLRAFYPKAEVYRAPRH